MNETTQQTIVQTLREKILAGELSPGQRLVEAQLAQWLGVSRTPLRYALSVLSSEGLLDRSGGRGYVVRRFSVRDVLNAIDVRGVLEGLAARSVAEHGVGAALAASLDDCLREGDDIFNQRQLQPGDDVRYAQMNGRFHALIVDAAQNVAVTAALSLNDKIPFVSAFTIAFDEAARERQFMMLMYAHRQHHAIADALKKGEGARVAR
jgi:GntR family transcriptional regulator of vanillate catabolism